MLAFVKRFRPVTLYAFTSTPRLAEVLPPVSLSQSPPRWWKNTPSHVALPTGLAPNSQLPTIKHCYGLQELFKRAIGFRLWHDVTVSIETDGRILSQGFNAALKRAGDPHPSIQFPNAFSGNTQHFKFYSPWL